MKTAQELVAKMRLYRGCYLEHHTPNARGVEVYMLWGTGDTRVQARVPHIVAKTAIANGALVLVYRDFMCGTYYLKEHMNEKTSD